MLKQLAVAVLAVGMAIGAGAASAQATMEVHGPDKLEANGGGGAYQETIVSVSDLEFGMTRAEVEGVLGVKLEQDEKGNDWFAVSESIGEFLGSRNWRISRVQIAPSVGLIGIQERKMCVSVFDVFHVLEKYPSTVRNIVYGSFLLPKLEREYKNKRYYLHCEYGGLVLADKSSGLHKTIWTAASSGTRTRVELMKADLGRGIGFIFVNYKDARNFKEDK